MSVEKCKRILEKYFRKTEEIWLKLERKEGQNSNLYFWAFLHWGEDIIYVTGYIPVTEIPKIEDLRFNIIRNKKENFDRIILEKSEQGYECNSMRY